MNAAPVLSVRDLKVGVRSARGEVDAVRGLDLDVARGETLALVGESGCGKSLTALALAGLLPDGARIRSGRIVLGGVSIEGLPERRLRRLRGQRVGMVFQDPMAALNPVLTIGEQIVEAIRAHRSVSRAQARSEAESLLARVRLREGAQLLQAFPHQLSGGMLQRVLIGLAVLPRPALLVADEPTSALDVTIQKRILDLLTRLQSELDISLLLITHDLAIAAERADALVVLKDVVIQEAGRTAAIFASPRSAYARELQADVPALNPDRYRALRDPGFRRREAGATAKIEVRAVTKTFAVDGRTLTAVDNVSFAVPAGTTHALVGESGSGKTTTIRLLLGLETPDSGTISVAGEQLSGRSPATLRAAWRHLQLIYQNPFTSLDPTWTVEKLVREPLDRFGIGTRKARNAQVRQSLADVGLGEHLLARKPGALSGGQRQRVAIARALVLRPDVIVLDEPTSALDVTVQADIVEVLLSLQANLGLTYVFVSHDLALVRQLAHTVSVMHRGRIVEHGSVGEIFDHPQQPYTRSLLASIPSGTTGRVSPSRPRAVVTADAPG